MLTSHHLTHRAMLRHGELDAHAAPLALSLLLCVQHAVFGAPLRSSFRVVLAGDDDDVLETTAALCSSRLDCVFTDLYLGTCVERWLRVLFIVVTRVCGSVDAVVDALGTVVRHDE